MQFVNPIFLWALGALLIPIIIHLFHFRKFKKVYFTNVHLLKEIKEETSTRSRLRNILVLLTRLAALGLLVLAFAQPVIRDQDIDTNKDQVVTVVIDNSFSMNALKAEVPLLRRAKDQAKGIIKSYSETDQFVILTPELRTKHLRLIDKKTAISFIDEIEATADIKTLEDISKVALRVMSDSEGQQNMYILSDFQENVSLFSTPVDSSTQVSLLPLRAVQENNIAIIDASFESPVPLLDVNNKLVVTLENYGSNDQSVQLNMLYEGQNRPQGVIEIAAESRAVDTISLLIDRAGWHEVELAVDDYPIGFDNNLDLSFYLKPQINILNIYNAINNSYLDKAFSGTDYYALTQDQTSQIRYDRFAAQDLIILDDLPSLSSGLRSELVKYVSQGGNLLVFPAESAQVEEYNALLSALGADRINELISEDKSVSRINLDEFVFSDVFLNKRKNLRLPEVKKHFSKINSQQAVKESILTFRDGSDYLTKYQKDLGQVYLSSAPLDEQLNGLVTNAEIFIPLLYKVAISSTSGQNLYYTIDEEEILDIKNLTNLSQSNYTVTGPSEFIPSVIINQGRSVIDVRDQIKERGIYNLTLEDQTIHKMAFNYDRIESDVSYGDMKAISAKISPTAEIINQTASADISQVIDSKKSGIQLWRWCLILALVFLLIETVLLRIWKAS